VWSGAGALIFCLFFDRVWETWKEEGEAKRNSPSFFSLFGSVSWLLLLDPAEEPTVSTKTQSLLPSPRPRSIGFQTPGSEIAGAAIRRAATREKYPRKDFAGATGQEEGIGEHKGKGMVFVAKWAMGRWRR